MAGAVIVYFFILLVLFILLILPCEKPPVEEPKDDEEEKQEEKPVEKPTDEQAKQEEKPVEKPTDEQAKQEEEPTVTERNIGIEEISEEPLSETASEEEKQQYRWRRGVRSVATRMRQVSSGQLRAINFCYLDQLIDVRGKNRPLAVFVPPKSSNLSKGGVFIYDTTRMEDNRLYLFAGPESPQGLRELGERLLNLMIKEKPKAKVERIIGVLEGPDFAHMIHQMGGHVDMMQSSHNAGDHLFFEIQFFKTMLHVFVFKDNEMTEPDVENPTLDLLPDSCSAVIDTSDNALYLYIADVNTENEQEQADQLAALQWMNAQPEFRHRDILIFDKSSVPPNLAIIFGQANEQ